MSSEKLLKGLVDSIIQPTINLLFVVAFVVFFWGVFQMIRKADNEEARSEGKQHLLYGTIGLVVMFIAAGIIMIIKNTFQI